MFDLLYRRPKLFLLVSNWTVIKMSAASVALVIISVLIALVSIIVIIISVGTVIAIVVIVIFGVIVLRLKGTQ